LRTNSLGLVLRRSLAVCSGLVVALAASGAAAQDRPTLSGTWSASGLAEVWSIGDWGEACGPRPAPHGAGGGVVSVSEGGGELTFGGGGYPRTSGCFEMGGGIGVTSHSASPRGWRTTCGTSAGDPRRATIITTISATDRLISFDETGQYQFILQGQNCTASVRRSRSYTLIKRLGEDPPPAASTAAPTPTATEAPKPENKPDEKPQPSSCGSPGDPARIEVKPARKVMKPGESFTPRAALFDEAGCRLAAGPSWSMQQPGGKVSVNAAGQITVAPDAGEGEFVVLAGVGGKAARVTVEVVSSERYGQLLATGKANSGEDDVAVAVLATGSMGSRAAVAQDGSGQRRLLFLGVVGGVVVVLAGVGVALMKRTRPELEAVEEEIPGETRAKVVRKARLVAKVPSSSALFCPSCKRGFSAGPVFCPEDGTKLEPNPAYQGPAGPAGGPR